MIWMLLYFGIKSFKLHAEIEQEFQHSELKLLRSQVHPHFLFNALATIMAVRKDEAMVFQVTQSLADYLRFSLAQNSQDQIKHPHGPNSTGIGIANLRKRLRLLYGDQATLTFDRTGTAVRAQVSLPVSGIV
jgi:LytS/YehU family sensor histidine kinase